MGWGRLMLKYSNWILYRRQTKYYCSHVPSQGSSAQYNSDRLSKFDTENIRFVSKE
jgi:hypothetical protein